MSRIMHIISPCFVNNAAFLLCHDFRNYVMSTQRCYSLLAVHVLIICFHGNVHIAKMNQCTALLLMAAKFFNKKRQTVTLSVGWSHGIKVKWESFYKLTVVVIMNLTKLEFLKSEPAIIVILTCRNATTFNIWQETLGNIGYIPKLVKDCKRKWTLTTEVISVNDNLIEVFTVYSKNTFIFSSPTYSMFLSFSLNLLEIPTKAFSFSSLVVSFLIHP